MGDPCKGIVNRKNSSRNQLLDGGIWPDEQSKGGRHTSFLLAMPFRHLSMQPFLLSLKFDLFLKVVDPIFLHTETVQYRVDFEDAACRNPTYRLGHSTVSLWRLSSIGRIPAAKSLRGR